MATALSSETHIFGWRAHLPRFSDPGLTGLRRASRAALLIPVLFALCSWLVPNPQFITFATFGCMALMVFGDFGGTSRPRATAYAVSTLVGLLVITCGSFASGSALTAALVVALGGFILQFAGVFGGYVTAAQLPLVLSLVLAVAIPTTIEQIPARLAGWLLGGLIALLGGVFLWPRHEHAQLRHLAAATCQAVADMVGALYGGSATAPRELAEVQEQARDAIARLSQMYRVTPHRPASPARADRAFAELVEELERMMKQLSAIRAMRLDDGLQAGGLILSLVQVLHASASVLDPEHAGGGPLPDLTGLAQERAAYIESLQRWSGERLRAGTAPRDVLMGLEAAGPLKVVTAVTMAIGANATLAGGLELQQDPETLGLFQDVEATPGWSATLGRVIDGITTHLRWSSIWTQNSLRAAIGLSVAVLLVDMLGVDHAFWAVLGTLSVLRSNALATGRTALAAIVGTTLGILPASLLLIPLGTQTSVLWAAFPIAVFGAAYAPSVIGFVAGQAAFTLLVVILFNLITPVGWTLELVRLQDVVIGAGLSLVVGVLFWPRGARGQLCKALGQLYRHDAAYLHAVFEFVFDRASAAESLAVRSGAVGEAARAGEVFDQFLLDRAAKALPPSTWGALQAGGSHLVLAADSLERLANHGYRVRSAAVADVLSGAAASVVERLSCLSESLEHGRTPRSSSSPPVSFERLRQMAVDNLGEWGGRDDPVRRGTALGLVTTVDWIHTLDALIDHLSGPASAAVRVANLPWWH